MAYFNHYYEIQDAIQGLAELGPFTARGDKLYFSDAQIPPQPWIKEVEQMGTTCVVTPNWEILEQMYCNLGDLAQKDPDRPKNFEFGSPNANKALHLGHLRNVALGTAIKNLLGGQAHCHFNDVGITICKSKWGAEADGLPKAEEKFDHYAGRGYQRYLNRPDGGAQEAEVMMQAWDHQRRQGKSTSLDVFAHRVVEAQKQTIKRVSASFFHETYESDLDVHAIKEDWEFQEGDGGYLYLTIDGKEKIVFRSDGTHGYFAQDLALMKHRMRHPVPPRKMMFITGREQEHHFAALKEAWGDREGEILHLSYSHVVDVKGKISSREGATTLDRAYDQVWDIIAHHMVANGCSPGVIRRSCHHATRAALLFFALKNKRNKELKFHPLALTGNKFGTGIYVAYASARLRSLQEKIEIKLGNDGFDRAQSEARTGVAKVWADRLTPQLFAGHTAYQKACDDYEPAHLATWLSKTCQVVNSLFTNGGKVLEAEKAELEFMQDYLRFVDQQIYLGADTLGFQVGFRL